MVYFSDKEVKKAYQELIKEYNREGWGKIASLDRFLHIKAETALKNGNGRLYNLVLQVIGLAETDY